MFNSKVLATMTVQLWEAYDARMFSKFRRIAIEMFNELGYNGASPKIGYHLTKANIYYAKMDDDLLGTNANEESEKKIKKYKEAIKNELEVAFRYAGFENSETLANYRSKWWINFFMEHLTKNKIYYLPSLWYLFLEHIKRSNNFLGSLNELLAPPAINPLIT